MLKISYTDLFKKEEMAEEGQGRGVEKRKYAIKYPRNKELFVSLQSKNNW